MAIANVVELKQVVSQRETAPIYDVAKTINIKLRLAGDGTKHPAMPCRTVARN
jgi:hypothetical protein